MPLPDIRAGRRAKVVDPQPGDLPFAKMPEAVLPGSMNGRGVPLRWTRQVAKPSSPVASPRQRGKTRELFDP